MKSLLYFYIICIHLTLLVALLNSDFVARVKYKFHPQKNEITKHYKKMTSFHSRIDKNLDSNSILFIGDSHIQGLAVSSIVSHGVNFGIGMDTTVGVLRRLPTYKSLTYSRAVVLAIGFNDLQRRDNNEIIENFKKIFALIPGHSKIILCSLHKVGSMKHKKFNKRIEKLNESLNSLSQEYRNVLYLRTFNDIHTPNNYLAREYLLNDNIHLSALGYDLWVRALRKALKEQL